MYRTPLPVLYTYDTNSNNQKQYHTAVQRTYHTSHDTTVVVHNAECTSVVLVPGTYDGLALPRVITNELLH